MLGLFNDFAKQQVLAVQEFTLLSARALHNVFRSPHYLQDTVRQMDRIGFGSLPIVVLTGFFTGAVLALQMSKTLATFGETSLTGQLVMLSLVRELGPVLTSLMMAGRNSSGIASELGSMVVSEQIDAMRALGTDPSKKLVTPRLIATVVMLPMLTIIADFVGLLGGFATSFFIIRLNPSQYWYSAYQALEFEDLFQGLLKPFVFAFIVALVGCYYGLTTRGGTEGVGRATTQAVVAASVMILVSDFFITKTILWALG
ncbi:MAG: ABC transporter permease [Acidobacteria bacterium]|nr:ABC transporter permease [Acidobacteriota bacterium]